MLKRGVFIVLWTLAAYLLAPMLAGLCLGFFFGVTTFFSGASPGTTLVKVLGVSGGIVIYVLTGLVLALGILGKLPGTKPTRATPKVTEQGGGTVR